MVCSVILLLDMLTNLNLLGYVCASLSVQQWVQVATPPVISAPRLSTYGPREMTPFCLSRGLRALTLPRLCKCTFAGFYIPHFSKISWGQIHKRCCKNYPKTCLMIILWHKLWCCKMIITTLDWCEQMYYFSGPKMRLVGPLDLFDAMMSVDMQLCIFAWCFVFIHLQHHQLW